MEAASRYQWCVVEHHILLLETFGYDGMDHEVSPEEVLNAIIIELETALSYSTSYHR